MLKSIGVNVMLNFPNYATLTDWNENLTHEDALGVSSCFFLSQKILEYPFSDKFFWLTPIGFVPTRIYPNFSLRKNFAKLNIPRQAQISFFFYSQALSK